LIPDNPTLLLTSAGMVPFVPIFLGQAPPTDPPRVVTVQKVTRAGGKDSDIENIGRTARHHSFFEMLGNFSFGDYFKKEVIPWAWEFVTGELGLEPERLSVTIFGGDNTNPADEEAFELWSKKVGVPLERIFRLGRKDNFWGPPGPTGPCGPCTEIYYDRGQEYGCNSDQDKCGIGKCECDRYLEIWNLVFMELFKDADGNFSPLANKNVDTGAGLERISTILQEKGNTFETDLLFPVLEELAVLAGAEYKSELGRRPDPAASNSDKINLYLKIVTDHARCVTMLVSDGVRTSNIGRGYVLRFIIRRAARFGRLLGLTEPFIYKLVPKVVELYQQPYPELAGQEEVIASVVRDEEDRFAKTIDRGIGLLESLLSEEEKQISGSAAFNLYATFGFPIELTAEIALERGKTVDMAGFAEAKKEHETVSSVNKFNVIITGEEAFGRLLRDYGTTKFTGYATTEDEGKIIAVVKQGKEVERIEEGEEAELVLDSTPFYAESGGQIGDCGLLSGAESTLSVVDTKKHEGLHVHKVKALSGIVEPGQKLKAVVDKERRQSTVLHHSTAHLFHAAVRELLGKHVAQAGSQVGPDAMRFDFSFERQLNDKEIASVENLMNEWVRLNLPVTTVEMPLEEAKRTGAVAMFGEKYGEIVRVVKMGDFSLEFCGGTHVSSTGEIGPIKIISEGSISSGVRRIEALAGPKAWRFIAQHLNILSTAANRLKVNPSDLLAQIDRLQDQIKQRDKQAQQLEEQIALSFAPELLAGAEKHGDLRVIAAKVSNVSADGLKLLAEHIRSKGDDLVVAVGTNLGPDKVSIVAAVSDQLVKRGINAGNLVKQAATICGGGGGGRPQLAQAGGKDPSKLDQALTAVKDLIKQEVNARA
jgi:alanyl-tRNA synthetase